ncbi:MAG TPA: DciA family protein [Candidatus Limnocylindria bacterium]|nr:DciA family protein [Candidatus Limnocylindria bacterium]
MRTNKGFSKIDKVLKQTAKQYNLEAALHRHKVLKFWDSVAQAFIEESRTLTQAVDFKKGVLTVACLSQEAAYKIKLLTQRIIYALNEMLGRQVVYAIHIEV